MKASDLFVKCLENENVDYMFGIPGEENVDLIDSLNNSGIKFILTRHEQGAAFMADIYGRITGRPGVCLSTLGPGATNLVTGVANAHLDKIPLVAITAQANTERIHKESHQNIDTIALFSGITKYNKAVLRASEHNSGNSKERVQDRIAGGSGCFTHTASGRRCFRTG